MKVDMLRHNSMGRDASGAEKILIILLFIISAIGDIVAHVLDSTYDIVSSALTRHPRSNSCYCANLWHTVFTSAVFGICELFFKKTSVS